MIHLICLGNPFHSDDGFGPVLHHALTRIEWPSDVRVLDGTGRHGGLSFFEYCDRAIVLEALPQSCGAPGQVVRLAEADYPAETEDTSALLANVRRIVKPVPRIEVLGPVSASRTAYSPGLTPLVAAAVETVAAMLVKEFGGKRPRRGRVPA